MDEVVWYWSDTGLNKFLQKNRILMTQKETQQHIKLIIISKQLNSKILFGLYNVIFYYNKSQM